MYLIIWLSQLLLLSLLQYMFGLSELNNKLGSALAEAPEQESLNQWVMMMPHHCNITHYSTSPI